MRALDANTTSGREGVIIAAVEWWLKTSGLEARMAAYVEVADVKQFKFRGDHEVGTQIVELLPDIREDFERRILEDAGIKYILALAIDTDLQNPDFVSELDGHGKRGVHNTLRRTFFAEVGQAFKRTDFFEKVKKSTPRSTVIKMATARLSALRKLLPLRNAAVRANNGRNAWSQKDPQSEEMWPDPATVELLRAMLGRMHLYGCAPDRGDQGEAWRKAHKELTSFLKRPDVDDAVIQEGMDLSDVSEIMER